MHLIERPYMKPSVLNDDVLWLPQGRLIVAIRFFASSGAAWEVKVHYDKCDRCLARARHITLRHLERPAR